MANVPFMIAASTAAYLGLTLLRTTDAITA